MYPPFVRADLDCEIRGIFEVCDFEPATSVSFIRCVNLSAYAFRSLASLSISVEIGDSVGRLV